MANDLHFASGFTVLGDLPSFSAETIKNEPMLFSADLNYAIDNGGPITQAFVRGLKDIPTSAVIDSRVHMLMPGWYPCIPGWHLDDVPRTRPDGQPDHAHPAYKSFNVMALAGDASIAEFIEGELDLSDVGLYEGSVYGQWNARINTMLAEPDCKIAIRPVSQNSIVRFDYGAFHRGVPASKNGWRFFIRANFNTAREIKNEIRRQGKAYLP